MHKNAITHNNGKLIIHHKYVGVAHDISLIHTHDSTTRPDSSARLYTLTRSHQSPIGRIYFMLYLSFVSKAIPEIKTSGYWNILIYRHISHAGSQFSLLNQIPLSRFSSGSHRYQIYNDPRVAANEITKIIHRIVCCFFFIRVFSNKVLHSLFPKRCIYCVEEFFCFFK